MTHSFPTRRSSDLKHPKAQIVAIDLLDMDELPNTTILKMDFLSDEAPQALIDALGAKADIVLSDMAANTVGHQQTDHLRTMALVEAGLEFATGERKSGV